MLLLLVFTGALSAQKIIYVKHDAAGANDGSSWANAYTGLSAALQTATSGDQVWVAAGVYKPALGTAGASFSLMAGVELYGGFNGTELALDARNPANHVVVLSGDHSGDDIAGDFTQKRADNATHVVEVKTGISPGERAVIDGFTIRGGHTKTGTANPDLSRRGGGILANVPLTVRNCRFTDNYGESGSGLAAVGAAASGIQADNCLFEGNEATASSAGIFFRDLSGGGEVNNCVFRNNKTNRGCLYLLTSSDITVDSCLFESNDAGANFAAGMFTWQSTFNLKNSVFRNNKANSSAAMYNDGRSGTYFFTIDNCLFENNTAANIGAINNWQASFLIQNCIFRGNTSKGFGQVYNDGREANDHGTFLNCLFENNVADDQDPAASTYGGAFYNWQFPYTMKHCTFRNNRADNAGAMYNDGSLFISDFLIDSCLFEGNRGLDYGGGAIYNWKSNFILKNTAFRNNYGNTAGCMYNGDSTYYEMQGCLFENNNAAFGAGVVNFGKNKGTIFDCIFRENTAVTSGGAMVNGFEADVHVFDCLFDGNKARFGGAINNQNDNTRLLLEHNTFFSNTAQDYGGAVNVGAGILLLVNDCAFEVNTADYGGAIAMAEDSLDLAKLLVANSTFLQNFATTQGAALNLLDTETELTNCLFISNINIGEGAGGAISNNATDGHTSSVKALNCTFADNAAPVGGGVAQWEAPSGNSTLTLQNCIFFNNIPNNYEVEDGAPEVVSRGGNLSGDNSLNDPLTQVNDLTQVDPMFVDAGNFDYHLQAGSPCIDKGVADGAPNIDLDGKPRTGIPDQGCFEFQVLGTHGPGSIALPLTLMPNPATDRTLLTVENDWAGAGTVRIFSQNGGLVRDWKVNKPAGPWVQALELSGLPAGVYLVRMQLGAQAFEGHLIKQ